MNLVAQFNGGGLLPGQISSQVALNSLLSKTNLARQNSEKKINAEFDHRHRPIKTKISMRHWGSINKFLINGEKYVLYYIDVYHIYASRYIYNTNTDIYIIYVNYEKKKKYFFSGESSLTSSHQQKIFRLYFFVPLNCIILTLEMFAVKNTSQCI